jgi:tripartite-type tricarboxylate transporter receptor subunit TctC
MRRRVGGILLAAVALTISSCSVQGGSAGEDGATYPNKAVEFTVPTEPGGSTDLITRALTKSIETPLGAQAIVVNKPGANGKIAGKDVFGAKPDGYRVAVMPQSLFAIGPLMVEDPEAIKLTDMTFIKGLAVEDYVLVVPADSPYKTLDDILKAKDVTYGTTGAGTGSQLSQALLFGTAKVPAAAVPFDGGGPTITAVLGGKVDAASISIAEAAPHVKAGKMRPLAVFAEKRVAGMPDVPTATELNRAVVVDQRRFVAGPAGMPDDVRDKLAGAIDKATATPEYNELLKKNNIGRWDADGAAVGEQLTKSNEQFKALIDKLGIDLTGQA